MTQRRQQNSKQSPYVPQTWFRRQLRLQRRAATATETCRFWSDAQKNHAEEKEGRKMVEQRPRVVPQILPYVSIFGETLVKTYQISQEGPRNDLGLDRWRRVETEI